MKTPLCLLAEKYGSDKFSTKHSYTAWYYEQFKDRRDTVRKVVEIGVGEGASLRMWREFFPNAWIVGVDNDETRMVNDVHINTYLCDQRRPLDLMDLVNVIGDEVDLFIDDGSHLTEDQLRTCKVTMPMLCKGVTYVIEDVADANIGLELTGKYKVYMPELERRRRYDNLLLVVKHA
jgi:demethylmacrocin O-methyltransferase